MVTEYLDYLWELGELPVYIIGGVGVAWEPGSNGLAIACTWGSSLASVPSGQVCPSRKGHVDSSKHD